MSVNHGFPTVVRWCSSATYFTEREKSPGALSLSLMRKAPSCLCLFSISSALARGIFPKNHLEEVENRYKSALTESSSCIHSIHGVEQDTEKTTCNECHFFLHSILLRFSNKALNVIVIFYNIITLKNK